MRILISGSSGLVGSALMPILIAKGHKIVRLVRKAPAKQGLEIFWNPEKDELNLAELEGFDAVVHLAGDPIAAGRWTVAKKKSIEESRVHGTRLLANALTQVSCPPEVLISASAIGYYGNRGDELLHEESPPGAGFLADVCREWEEAADFATKKNIRVVMLRFGMILSARGGALGKLLPPFRLGLGGVLGDGRQYMSWITLEDVVEVIQFALQTKSIQGPVNIVTPQPVTNQDFTKTLGKILKRPTVFPVPAFAARLAFGEMADALLLSSQRVEPRKLQQAGYKFRYPILEGALRRILERSFSPF